MTNSQTKVKWWQRLFAKVTTGYDIDPNLYIETDWIRYRDIYILILKDAQTGEYNVSFQKDIPDYPLVEMLITDYQDQSSKYKKLRGEL